MPQTTDKTRNAVIEALRSRKKAIESDAARTTALFEEERILSQTAEYYRENGDGGHAAFLDGLRARIDEVGKRLIVLLPLHNENRLITSMLATYEREDTAVVEPEVLAGLRRTQRAQIVREIEWRNRVDQDRLRARDSEVESASASVRAVRERNITRNDVFHARGTASAPLSIRSGGDASQSAVNSPAHQAALVTIKPVGSSALLTADETGANSSKRNATDAVGAATVEFMARYGVPEIAFTRLYKELRAVIFEFSDSPSEKARIENFRYHLKAAASRYGFEYERGYVKLIGATTVAIEGGKAAQNNG